MLKLYGVCLCSKSDRYIVILANINLSQIRYPGLYGGDCTTEMPKMCLRYGTVSQLA